MSLSAPDRRLEFMLRDYSPEHPFLTDVQAIHDAIARDGAATTPEASGLLETFLDRHPARPNSTEELRGQMLAHSLYLLFGGSRD